MNPERDGGTMSDALEVFQKAYYSHVPIITHADAEKAQTAGVRAVVEKVLEVLEGQGIGLDSELDNWTFHAPFWAIRRAMGLDPEEDA